MKKILNYFFDSNSENYFFTLGNKVVFSLGSEGSWIDRKEIEIKDFKLSINSLDFISTLSSWKTWTYIPETIYVVLENNHSSNSSFIRNDFPYFCVLDLNDILKDSFITSTGVGDEYTIKTYKYSLRFKPPKLDLSTNVCVFTFWGFDKSGSAMKEYTSLFLGSYTPSTGGKGVVLREIDVTKAVVTSNYLKSGITINISIEV